jgi:hypothetical protein
MAIHTGTSIIYLNILTNKKLTIYSTQYVFCAVGLCRTMVGLHKQGVVSSGWTGGLWEVEAMLEGRERGIGMEKSLGVIHIVFCCLVFLLLHILAYLT